MSAQVGNLSSWENILHNNLKKVQKGQNMTKSKSWYFVWKAADLNPYITSHSQLSQNEAVLDEIVYLWFF